MLGIYEPGRYPSGCGAGTTILLILDFSANGKQDARLKNRYRKLSWQFSACCRIVRLNYLRELRGLSSDLEACYVS
jgi:hypothetical protein